MKKTTVIAAEPMEDPPPDPPTFTATANKSTVGTSWDDTDLLLMKAYLEKNNNHNNTNGRKKRTNNIKIDNTYRNPITIIDYQEEHEDNACDEGMVLLSETTLKVEVSNEDVEQQDEDANNDATIVDVTEKQEDDEDEDDRVEEGATVDRDHPEDDEDDANLETRLSLQRTHVEQQALIEQGLMEIEEPNHADFVDDFHEGLFAAASSNKETTSKPTTTRRRKPRDSLCILRKRRIEPVDGFPTLPHCSSEDIVQLQQKLQERRSEVSNEELSSTTTQSGNNSAATTENILEASLSSSSSSSSLQPCSDLVVSELEKTPSDERDETHPVVAIAKVENDFGAASSLTKVPALTITAATDEAITPTGTVNDGHEKEEEEDATVIIPASPSLCAFEEATELVSSSRSKLLLDSLVVSSLSMKNTQEEEKDAEHENRLVVSRASSSVPTSSSPTLSPSKVFDTLVSSVAPSDITVPTINDKSRSSIDATTRTNDKIESLRSLHADDLQQIEPTNQPEAAAFPSHQTQPFDEVEGDDQNEDPNYGDPYDDNTDHDGIICINKDPDGSNTGTDKEGAPKPEQNILEDAVPSNTNNLVSDPSSSSRSIVDDLVGSRSSMISTPTSQSALMINLYSSCDDDSKTRSVSQSSLSNGVTRNRTIKMIDSPSSSVASEIDSSQSRLTTVDKDLAFSASGSLASTVVDSMTRSSLSINGNNEKEGSGIANPKDNIVIVDTSNVIVASTNATMSESTMHSDSNHHYNKDGGSNVIGHIERLMSLKPSFSDTLSTSSSVLSPTSASSTASNTASSHIRNSEEDDIITATSSLTVDEMETISDLKPTLPVVLERNVPGANVVDSKFVDPTSSDDGGLIEYNDGIVEVNISSKKQHDIADSFAAINKHIDSSSKHCRRESHELLNITVDEKARPLQEKNNINIDFNSYDDTTDDSVVSSLNDRLTFVSHENYTTDDDDGDDSAVRDPQGANFNYCGGSDVFTSMVSSAFMNFTSKQAADYSSSGREVVDESNSVLRSMSSRSAVESPVARKPAILRSPKSLSPSLTADSYITIHVDSPIDLHEQSHSSICSSTLVETTEDETITAFAVASKSSTDDHVNSPIGTLVETIEEETFRILTATSNSSMDDEAHLNLILAVSPKSSGVNEDEAKPDLTDAVPPKQLEKEALKEILDDTPIVQLSSSLSSKHGKDDRYAAVIASSSSSSGTEPKITENEDFVLANYSSLTETTCGRAPAPSPQLPTNIPPPQEVSIQTDISPVIAHQTSTISKTTPSLPLQPSSESVTSCKDIADARNGPDRFSSAITMNDNGVTKDVVSEIEVLLNATAPTTTSSTSIDQQATVYDDLYNAFHQPHPDSPVFIPSSQIMEHAGSDLPIGTSKLSPLHDANGIDNPSSSVTMKTISNNSEETFRDISPVSPKSRKEAKRKTVGNDSGTLSTPSPPPTPPERSSLVDEALNDTSAAASTCSGGIVRDFLEMLNEPSGTPNDSTNGNDEELHKPQLSYSDSTGYYFDTSMTPLQLQVQQESVVLPIENNEEEEEERDVYFGYDHFKRQSYTLTSGVSCPSSLIASSESSKTDGGDNTQIVESMSSASSGVSIPTTMSKGKVPRELPNDDQLESNLDPENDMGTKESTITVCSPINSTKSPSPNKSPRKQKRFALTPSNWND